MTVHLLNGIGETTAEWNARVAKHRDSVIAEIREDKSVLAQELYKKLFPKGE